MAVSPVDPAYHIPLTDAEFKLIGEICAIQGQIEFEMINTVAHLLSLTRARAALVLGTSNVGSNANIWLGIVNEKTGARQDLRDIANKAFAELRNLAEGRNDFIHAIFLNTSEDGATYRLSTNNIGDRGKVVGMRVRNAKMRPATDLHDVRDRAAKISCMMAHIHICVISGSERTEWLDKF